MRSGPGALIPFYPGCLRRMSYLLSRDETSSAPPHVCGPRDAIRARSEAGWNDPTGLGYCSLLGKDGPQNKLLKEDYEMKRYVYVLERKRPTETEFGWRPVPGKSYMNKGKALDAAVRLTNSYWVYAVSEYERKGQVEGVNCA